MDLADFLLKTVFELFGWIFGLIIKLATAVIGGIFKLIASAFSNSGGQ